MSLSNAFNNLKAAIQAHIGEGPTQNPLARNLRDAPLAIDAIMTELAAIEAHIAELEARVSALENPLACFAALVSSG